MRPAYKIIIACVLFMYCLSCTQDQGNGPMFVLMDVDETGIDFSNNLEYTKDFNVYKYRNFYNGGGVAIGDINNDGLEDIYMVSNMGSNKLYLNEGGFKFKDITEKSGANGDRAWSTGVAFVDINNDGLLDIYVCNSGDIKGDNKENELFINQGDLTFVESAKEYGLNDKGYSTHASFFDYDKDGDLDVYILNNSYQAIGSFNLKKNERGNRDELGGDKLMENVDGKYVDVSAKAGIYGSVIGFGLGVTISDFNNDGWDDLFISNDFFERDYLYINNQDGTFKEDLTNCMHSISAASMGADAADINNDGHSDLFVTDMLPSEYERLKTVTTFDDWNRYSYNLSTGYHHQFTRNMLQINNGNNSFSEISRYAGVDASDWSWGALFFDMDNDGFKDLFIANGIYKDLTNQDYLQYIANEQVMTSLISEEGVNYKELIDIIPSNPIANHAYKNIDGGNFEKLQNSGLDINSFSNGSAYGDLDNDGDLDLVVNNVNMQSFVFQNQQNDIGNNYVKIKLEGLGKNKFGIGARINVIAGDQTIQYENFPTRGFQSNMDGRPNIGVGNAKNVDIKITWSSGKVSTINNVVTNQMIIVKEEEAVESLTEIQKDEPIFQKTNSPVDYVKEENKYSDFNRERLIYHMRSNEGAYIGRGDLNGDGLEDLVFPGAKSIVTQIYFQDQKGNYTQQPTAADLLKIKEAEHTDCALLDVDNDGDLDIYLASGGVELSEYSEYLYDHLLINDGSGVLSLTNQKLPSLQQKSSTSTVDHADIDNDGDIDIVVGERMKIGKFGAAASVSILENDGKGIYTDNTATLCSDCSDLGMITDLQLGDIDGDGDQDILVVGEFMQITTLINTDGSYRRSEIDTDIGLKGWWNTLKLVDIDKDGDLDILAGNWGENSRFEASKDRPVKLYFSDYDQNGSPEGIMTMQREDGKDYPYSLRHNLIDQIKRLKKKFPDFESFKTADMTVIFTPEELAAANVLETNNFKTVVLINNGNLSFSSIELPKEVQYSPVYAIEAADFDRDGDLDIVLGGNLYNVVPEMGIYDATFGQLLLNNGDQAFTLDNSITSLHVEGEIRDFIVSDSLLMVQVSRDTLRTFRY